MSVMFCGVWRLSLNERIPQGVPHAPCVQASVCEGIILIAAT